MEPTLDPGLARELRRRIAAGEGRRLELKRGLPGDGKVARTLAAFANGVGGLLVVGVDDDGTLVGAPHPTETAEHLAAIARSRVEPPIEPWVFALLVEGVRLVACVVATSQGAPHRALGPDERWEATRRRAASTRHIDAREAESDARRRRALDAVETSILARIALATRAGEYARTEAAALAGELGLAPSRVRRALVALERHGHVFGWDADGGARRRVAIPPPRDGAQGSGQSA